jgi:predicted phage terminase large subunit-like protein
LDIKEVEWYTQKIIPNIEKRLTDKTLSTKEKLELYNAYVDTMKIVAPHDFITFNKYLELDDDHSNPNKAFYHHRKDHLSELFKALNDMEIYDAYDLLLVSTIPRSGKTTTGIRFLAWIIGRKPWGTQLATSYSDAITSSFYAGVMEIVLSERYQEVFPESPLVNQNAKRQEIWLSELKRYPSISFVSIAGSMTGRSEASHYLYADDLVSGIEEAMSLTRLEKLWQLYTVNAKQRKKDKAKEIHVATKWSVRDVITQLGRENEDNPRCKIINIPAYNEEGESNFDYLGGFRTEYFKELEKSMDKISFGALYMCNPIEREGLLYHDEDLQYYFDLPDVESEKRDSVVAVVDSKNLGKDNVACPIGVIYGDLVYIEDVVYNNGLPEVTTNLVANKLVEHNVVRCDVEMNNGGNYYAEKIDTLVKEKGGKTSIRMFFTGNNKDTKIITYSDFVKKHFVFKDPSQYSPNGDYARFMKDVFAWTQMGRNKWDDAPDSLAMLAQLVQELQGNSVKIIDRRKLGI